MKHSTYFDGKVQSLEMQSPSGRATVGVIEPGKYTFSTSSEEHIVLVEGRIKVKLPGGEWQDLQQGREVVVQSGVSFDIDAPVDAAYICYYR
jgi:purine/pyrimidine-nucleoside phosphorylase